MASQLILPAAFVAMSCVEPFASWVETFSPSLRSATIWELFLAPVAARTVVFLLFSAFFLIRDAAVLRRAPRDTPRSRVLAGAKVASRYEIADDAFAAAHWRVVPLAALNQFFTVPLVHAILAVVWLYTQAGSLAEWRARAGGWLGNPAVGIFLLVLQDQLVYWNHRAEHSGSAWLLHRVHHAVPQIAFASEYGHPLELLRENLLYQGFWAVLGLPLPLYIPIAIITEVGNTINHAGWAGSGNAHALHHLLVNKNFGAIPHLSDKMWGTFADPDDPESWNLKY